MSDSESDTYSNSLPRPSLSDELDEAFDQGPKQDTDDTTAFLVGLSGKHAGKLFRLKPGDSIIGRSSRALVALDEKAVSHQHARLTLTSAGCILRDLESTNGTILNDEKVTGPKELRAGDVLRFGNSTLGYLTDAEDESQHTRALARVTQPTIGGSQLIVSPSPSGTSTSVGGLVHVSASESGLIQVSDAGALAVDEPEVNPLDSALDKLDLGIAFLKSHWRLIAICSVLCAGAGAATISFKPPVATAEFEIFLREAQTEGTARYFATRNVDYFASAEKNFSNLELVRTTMIDMKMPAPDALVRGTARGLTFRKAGLSIYRGSYGHEDSKFAEKFLAQHLKNYLEREIGKSIKVLHSEVELLRTQYQDNEALLKEHEGALRDFKEEHLSTLPASGAAQVGARIQLITSRDRLTATSSRTSKQLALAKRQLASEDAFVGSKVIDSQPYKTALTRVRQQIAAAQAQGFADGHPTLVKLRGEEQELALLRDSTINSVTTQTERRSNPEHKRLKNLIGSLEVAVASTGQELSQVQTRLAEINQIAGDMPEVEAQIAGKIREVEASKKLHDKLYDQLKAKELELQFERASVAARYEVMEPPHAYPLNIQVSTIKRSVVGAAAGIVLGIILAALSWLWSYARNRRRDVIVTSPSP